MSNECFLPRYEIHDVGSAQALSQIYPQNVRDLNIPKIWSKSKGKGVFVMVLDTGCPIDHPDLMKNVDLSKCRSFIEGEDIFDSYVGHGIHCAGTIGAVDNTEGIVGIAPEVTIITAKVLDKNGRSQNDSILKGLQYCLKVLPDVINLSLGGPNPMPEVHEVIKKLTAQGVVIVCAAGNNGEENILYPAKYEEVITVGSYSDTILKDRSSFSSWGKELDIMAPGNKILSTYLNKGYAVLSGTSMATPVVSGVVALILAKYKAENKNLSVDEVKKMLYTTAIDVGNNGWDSHSGWGIINPESIFGEVVTIQGFPKKGKLKKIIHKILKFFKIK
jgi:major intracellular serine protease